MNPAVLMVDMQPGYLKYVNWRSRLVDNQKKILGFCKDKDIPVVKIEFTGVCRGLTIEELDEEWRKVPRRSYVSKHKCNAFENPYLEIRLSAWDANCLLAIGISGSECIYDTALGAKREGFEIFTSYGLIADNFIEYEPNKGLDVSTPLLSSPDVCPLLESVDAAIGKLEELLK